MTHPLVIFDCDGVLVDSEKLAIQIDQAMLADLGLNFSLPEVIEKFVGKSDVQFKVEVELLLGKPLPTTWIENLNEQYRLRFEKELKPVSGIYEVLENLGQPYCLASSGTPEKIRNSLRITGLLRFFEDRIYSAVDVKNGKPAPDLFLHAASSLGYAPSNCIVVEDSVTGVQAGLSAGMSVIAYSGSVTAPEKLQFPGVRVISSMEMLTNSLLSKTH